MTAEEWAAELLRVIRVDGQGRARSFAEAGYPLPWGVELALPTGAVVYLQAVADPSGGARPAPGAGVPQAERVELPAEGPTELAAVERWLAWCLSASPRIGAVALFQHRRGRTSIPHGLAARTATGARLWVYVRHATPAGRSPQGMALWRLQPTV
ncbi:hypothetical protein [Streptomyces longwoodensis]|uniref:hypothetical protein n=1 Tax=Streptomyces longwoodensis TaxID=68231 RepID=UPI0036F98B7A